MTTDTIIEEKPIFPKSKYFSPEELEGCKFLQLIPLKKLPNMRYDFMRTEEYRLKAVMAHLKTPCEDEVQKLTLKPYKPTYRRIGVIHRGKVKSMTEQDLVFRIKNKLDFDEKKFCVHHVNGDILNNKITNLALLPKGLHVAYHTSCKNEKPSRKSLVKFLQNRGIKLENMRLFMTPDSCLV